MDFVCKIIPIIRPFCQIKKFPLDLLPDEILLNILSYVPSSDLALQIWMRLGNIRLRRLCQDATLFRSITVDAAWDKDTARAVLSMAGDRLEELTVAVRKKKNYSYFNYYWESLVVGRIFWSPHRYVADSVVSDAALSDLLSTIGKCVSKVSLRRLKIITQLSRDCMEQYPLSCTLVANASSLRSLTSIDLEWVRVGVDGHSLIKPIADSCVHLERARFPFSCIISNELFSYFLERVQERLTHFLFYGYMLTGDAYFNLKQCRYLEELHVKSAHDIREEGIRAIMELPELRKLAISSAKYLNGDDLVQILIGKTRPKMACLEMYDMAMSIDDRVLELISKSCPNLLGLFLHGIPNQGVSQVGVRHVMDGCKKLIIFYINHFDSKESRPSFQDFKCYPKLVEGCAYLKRKVSWRAALKVMIGQEGQFYVGKTSARWS